MAPLADISPRKENPSLRMEGFVALEEMMSIMLFLGGWAAVGGSSVTALGASASGSASCVAKLFELLFAVLDLLNILGCANHFLWIDWVATHQNLQMKMFASR